MDASTAVVAAVDVVKSAVQVHEQALQAGVQRQPPELYPFANRGLMGFWTDCLAQLFLQTTLFTS